MYMVAYDDGVSTHIVPAGTLGDLLGCRGTLLCVRWDFHAVGPSLPKGDDDLPGICCPGLTTEVTPEYVEVVSADLT